MLYTVNSKVDAYWYFLIYYLPIYGKYASNCLVYLIKAYNIVEWFFQISVFPSIPWLIDSIIDLRKILSCLIGKKYYAAIFIFGKILHSLVYIKWVSFSF